MMEPPVLDATRIVYWPGLPPRLVAWCPYCEDLHVHGVEDGRSGVFAPACFDPASRSPFLAAGYRLDVRGEGRSISEALPNAPLVNHRPLWRRVDEAAHRLQALFAAVILGIRQSSCVLSGDLRDLSIRGSGPSATFWVSGPAWKLGEREGEGLSGLAQALNGVPRSVAAVRLLAAAVGEDFDAQCRLEIAAALDRFYARRGM